MDEVKLWHDDIRPAPPGWLWARTNEEAQAILKEHVVVECSLDHDLGLHEVEELPEEIESLIDLMALTASRVGQTGYDLVNWMIVEDIFPAVITIHSWNPEGANAMAQRLARCAPEGTSLTVRPFDPADTGPRA